MATKYLLNKREENLKRNREEGKKKIQEEIEKGGREGTYLLKRHPWEEVENSAFNERYKFLHLETEVVVLRTSRKLLGLS